MARHFNLNFLKEISNDLEIEEISKTFYKIIEELEIFLDLESIQKNINISFGEFSSSEKRNNILDLGIISRKFDDNELNIKISKRYKKFLPILLLKEAYLTFLPFSLTKNDAIKIFINQIVEINLQELKIIDEWKTKISQIYVNYDFLESQFDRLREFFQLNVKEGEINSAIEFFFNYIRNNLLVFQNNRKDLYDIIFKNFIYKTSKSLNNNDIIETIRLLIKILYEEKTYRAFIDYKNYFLEYKREKKINTELSLREFVKNFRWIKNFTYIGPSYQVNWRLIGIKVFFCILTFNPRLSMKSISKFITNLPFFYQSSSSQTNFSIKFFGWFVIPELYQNDLINFLKKLRELGYLNEYLFIEIEENHNFLNLNYFREKFFRKKTLLDIKHRAYRKKYEISFRMKYFKSKITRKLSILDFIILDRIRYFSITGFSFEQRNVALRRLKSDLIHEIISQKKVIKDFKNTVRNLRKNKQIINRFTNFIETNKKFGFFYIKEILITLIDSIQNTIDIIDKHKINNLYDLRDLLINQKISKNLNQNLILKDKFVINILFKDIFPDYFYNREKFLNRKKEFEIYRDYLFSCESLRIYDLDAVLKIIQDENLINRIFQTKKEKLEKSYKKSLFLNFNKEDLQNKLNEFIFRNPPLIKPLLITTISVGTFAKYYIQIVIRKNTETLKILNNLKKYFPRAFHNIGKDFVLNTDVISTHIWLHGVTCYEKMKLISIIFNLFDENLLSLRRYFFDGLFEPYSRKDFYDFEKKNFFYTQDLFTQYLKYSKAIFKKRTTRIPYIERSKKESLFWFKNEKNLNILNKEIADRISRENLQFLANNFKKLRDFHQNLKSNLLDNDKFNILKKRSFFEQYIDHIYFIPNYQKFGYSYYYLYINPSNLNEIDFRLLFINNFDKIQYPGYIDSSKCLLITYLFPYRTPNDSYLNWLTKSKKIIDEYCLFYIKNVYQLFHFDYNIFQNGWDLNPNRFKSFYQNILFKTDYKLKPSLIKKFQLENIESGMRYLPESREFKILTNLYAFEGKDLKTILTLKNVSEIKNVEKLLEKNLLFPYIETKNLGLIEELTIILPNIEKEVISQLIKIFSFFNFGFIYEIEGKYYIKGDLDEVFFENGLLIHLKLPDCHLGEFIQNFHKIFQYLNIEKYLILNDLLKGIPLLKNIYSNLEFLDEYNPFQNLEWNEKDKIWMNWKLFDEEFNFIYPDLIRKKSK